MAQWRHLLPSPPLFEAGPILLSIDSFFFGMVLTVFLPELEAMSDSDSDDIVVVVDGESTRRREVQLHGAVRERLLRALPGTVISGLKMWLFRLFSSWNWWFSVLPPLRTFIPEINCSFCKSSLENDSSTKLDSHSSSAMSSYYTKGKFN